MKTIKTENLTGAALNLAVAKCMGHLDNETIIRRLEPDEEGWCIAYSSDWSQGGPIIEREEMYVRPTGDAAKWSCYVWGKHPDDGVEQFIHEQFGPTPLIAAMRCFVASKLGAEVEVPEKL